ncbi:hypothetical protein NEILACOT_04026 [Neisseria lactamica ATCC 23970]|uniref:Uncharacterized protein n=1 Tax=Neisseria lactamica ATCC 23970 TaxID=546265 RepID=D0W921_NEILA|nr:hypothetical protein NEILACOT_04026 [Neisseria lactamica ATCC 23970]
MWQIYIQRENALCRLKVFQTASVSLTQEGIPSVWFQFFGVMYEPSFPHRRESCPFGFRCF